MINQTKDTLWETVDLQVVADELAAELAGQYRYVVHWQRWYWAGINGWDKQPIAEIEAALLDQQHTPTQADIDYILELLTQDDRIQWKDPDE